MGKKTTPVHLHQTPRRNSLFQEQTHDTYKTKGKLPEPTACSHCDAIFKEGRWQWCPNHEAIAQQGICPACHRIQDHYPAGFLTLEGDFFLAHREEIMHLIHNIAEHERAEHPLKRIMEVEDQGNATLITTTDIHLARGIGEAVHHAYQGHLELHYNQEENLLRASWIR